MENIRKFYLPIVHFLSLGLLGYMLIISPFYVEYEKGTTQDEINSREINSRKLPNKVYVPENNPWLVFNIRNKLSSVDDITYADANILSSSLVSDIETERQNRALIVYTLLAMYLGSGYLLFKKN